ncbi:MAG: methyltransferase domain-containing protein [Bacteroidales bacterium]|nr:methyltransferase domain-containing protein [Bacteroidales bacterium]
MHKRNWPVAILIALLFFIHSCKPSDNGSMQPFDGYPLIENRDEIRQILKDKCLDTIHFRKGEVIADIGAGNGYLEGMLSVYTDSLTFYIQDIDTTVCNQKAVNEAVDFYQNVRGRPVTNEFFAVNGTDSTTNLPDSTFDKILMLWTYPYIKKPGKFMTDIRVKLKDGGLFYVINPAMDYDDDHTLILAYGWNASPLEKQISDIIGWGFELIRISRNYEDPELPYIMVFKKKNLPAATQEVK